MLCVVSNMLLCNFHRGRWAVPPAEGGPRPLAITVRRSAIVEDGYTALRNTGEGIKGPLQVCLDRQCTWPGASSSKCGLTAVQRQIYRTLHS